MWIDGLMAGSFNNIEKSCLECIVRRWSPQSHTYNAQLYSVPKLTMHAVACIAKEFTFLDGSMQGWGQLSIIHEAAACPRLLRIAFVLD